MFFINALTEINKEALLSQKTFRILLKAMAHPGRIYPLPANCEIQNLYQGIALVEHNYALALILKTLLDHEIGFCVLGEGKKELETLVMEFTGSFPTDLESADFILVSDGDSKGQILKAKEGTLEYPETGASIIFCVKYICDSPIKNQTEKDLNCKVRFKGPGIKGEISAYFYGLKADEFHYLKEKNSQFPLGIDSIFVDAEANVLCVPRSTNIEVL